MVFDDVKTINEKIELIHKLLNKITNNDNPDVLKRLRSLIVYFCNQQQ